MVVLTTLILRDMRDNLMLTRRLLVLVAMLLLACDAQAEVPDRTSSMQQAVTLQNDVQQGTLRTLATLHELSDELVFNRFRDPALTRQVGAVAGALDKAGHEFMESSVQELRKCLDLADGAARRGQIAELARLQEKIMALLTSIRNARMAADSSRLRRLLEAVLRGERMVADRTKALLFDPKERVSSGRGPDELESGERSRLDSVAALQAGTVDALQRVLRELQSASGVKESAVAKKAHEVLVDARAAEKAAQALDALEQNRAMQALGVEQAVIAALEQALALMAGAVSDVDRKMAELASMKDRVKALLDQQVALRREAELFPGSVAEPALREAEARQDRLGTEAGAVRDLLGAETLARKSLQQAAIAMELAEQQLAAREWKKGRVEILESMGMAEAALAAALLALEEEMTALDNGEPENGEKAADALKQQAEATAALAKALEAAAKQEQTIEKETQQAMEQQRDATAVAKSQEALERQAQALQQQAEKPLSAGAPAGLQQAMKQAAAQIQQARQNMQAAAQQLQQGQPQAALPMEQQARAELQASAGQMQQASAALQQMQQAAQLAAMAGQLGAMAAQEAALQEQLDKAQDAEAKAKVQKAQKALQEQLASLQKQQAMSPNAAQADKAMQEAQEQMQAMQKEPGTGGLAKPKAKKAMMKAQSALQQEAQQMQQAAGQMQQAAEQAMDSAGKPKDKLPGKPGLGMGGGNMTAGDTTVRAGTAKAPGKWEASMSKRERVQFGQDAQLKLPPGYSKIIEGYFRRLAEEGREK